MNFNKQFFALVFLVMLSISLTAVADEETEDVVVMEDIVVTARKREQRSFEVPFSVSTVRGEKFDALRSSGMDVRFLSNRTPSLQMESSFGRIFHAFLFAAWAIRILTSTLRSRCRCSTTGLYSKTQC